MRVVLTRRQSLPVTFARPSCEHARDDMAHVIISGEPLLEPKRVNMSTWLKTTVAFFVTSSRLRAPILRRCARNFATMIHFSYYSHFRHKIADVPAPGVV